MKQVEINTIPSLTKRLNWFAEVGDCLSLWDIGERIEIFNTKEDRYWIGEVGVAMVASIEFLRLQSLMYKEGVWTDGETFLEAIKRILVVSDIDYENISEETNIILVGFKLMNIRKDGKKEE